MRKKKTLKWEEAPMDYDNLLELLKKRRSTRRYVTDPVPDEAIDKIIEAARWAPSGFNQQPWEFVVVKDPKLKKGIVEICTERMKLSAKMERARESWQGSMKVSPPSDEGGNYSVAPVFILLLGDTRTQKGLPMTRRYDEAQGRLAFISGLASAFLYMHLAATSLGLASQWVSAASTAYGNCMIKNLLGIPEEMVIYDMMALGYPAAPHQPRPLREKDKMIHFDKCGPDDFRSNEEVNDFILKTRKVP
jgi:nitroreductase